MIYCMFAMCHDINVLQAINILVAEPGKYGIVAFR